MESLSITFGITAILDMRQCYDFCGPVLVEIQDKYYLSIVRIHEYETGMRYDHVGHNIYVEEMDTSRITAVFTCDFAI